MSIQKGSEAESLQDAVMPEWQMHLEQVRQKPENLSADLLWHVLSEFQKCSFYTVKGILFSYSIRGNEMFADRKEKSITRATVVLAARRVLEKQAQGMVISGPKKIGTFGASYLYPIFLKIGLIVEEKECDSPEIKERN